ncbi:hypothetical protein OHA40_31430 [Nocardia sp. NBC_00508]|uniref:hypothetical protein n=1 Tax=Nocardia sp. NBC_00508 TaxID=2975992 RepID=UPI002E821F0A|nr:hypothetical protein [Nocardia sp. NBC_00508]WUD66037.1 hypothetical protein OHA40_31430 [Nocardia sp. NBC_00508]
MYSDLLTQANLLDHDVWTNSDAWTSALEYQARKRNMSSKDSRTLGAIFCIGSVVLVLGIVYLVTKHKK